MFSWHSLVQMLHLILFFIYPPVSCLCGDSRRRLDPSLHSLLIHWSDKTVHVHWREAYQRLVTKDSMTLSKSSLYSDEHFCLGIWMVWHLWIIFKENKICQIRINYSSFVVFSWHHLNWLTNNKQRWWTCPFKQKGMSITFKSPLETSADIEVFACAHIFF